MSEVHRKVRRITVEFEDGSKSSFKGTEGYLRKEKTKVPVENVVEAKWPTIESVSVHLKIADSRDDSVKPSEQPQSLPDAPGEA